MYEFYNPHQYPVNCTLSGGGTLEVAPGSFVPTPEMEAKGIDARLLADYVANFLLHHTREADRRSLLAGKKVVLPTLPIEVTRSAQRPDRLETRTVSPKTDEGDTLPSKASGFIQNFGRQLDEACNRRQVVEAIRPAAPPVPVALSTPSPAVLRVEAEAPSAEVTESAPQASVAPPVPIPEVSPLDLVRNLKKELETKRQNFKDEMDGEGLQRLADKSCSSGTGKKGKRIEEP